MKRNAWRDWLLSSLLPLSLLAACDVHEFPDQSPVPTAPVVLDLSFDGEMPLHQVVEIATRASENPDDYDLRYTVGVYRAAEDGTFGRKELTRLTVTKDDVSDPDLRIETRLEEGSYRFIVWTDHVDAGSQTHKFFNTDNFAEIGVMTDGYTGTLEFRDAFRGVADATVQGGESPCVIPVRMERPQARYRFVSTDLVEFMTRVQTRRSSQKTGAGSGAVPTDEETRSIDLNDFHVVIRYAGYMPSAFNLFTDRTADAATGIQFESRITKQSDAEADLGFDYVLVNDDEESSIRVALEIYDRDGTRLSATDPFDIPLKRGKETLVRGKFLTSEASGGIGISPGFDGDWIYPVQ